MTDNDLSFALGEITGKLTSLIALVQGQSVKHEEQEKRITALETWKTTVTSLVVGGAAVIAFLWMIFRVILPYITK